MAPGQAFFVDGIRSAADYVAPGAIEINRYQSEIFDLVKRRLPFGQRINQMPATGQPSRYFEQLAIPGAAFTDPRIIAPTAGQPKRVERVVTLKAMVSQLNYGIFDLEVNNQQGQFAYLEAKDLSDAVDGLLKLHDQNLWDGTDTDLVLPTTQQYYGCSGQIINAPQVGTYPNKINILSSASIIDTIKTEVAKMVARKDYEVKPSGWYANPLTNDLIDQEAKTLQLYYNEVEVTPGVIVKAIPTQAGLVPLISDPAITVLPVGAKFQHTGFITSEEFIEYHWLTSPAPRVFQLGLLGNLASQFVILKFGAVVVKGASYAHGAVIITTT
jgi:hypothetical protein